MLGLHWTVNVIKPEGYFGAWFAGPVESSGVIPQTAEVFAAARHPGIPIVYTRFVIPDGGGQLVKNTPVMTEVAELESFRPDAAHSAVIPELPPGPDDRVVDNQKLSGLAGSDIVDWLRERPIDTLVLTGVATNLTVEQTARHATDLGFAVWVLADCVTAAGDDVHAASIANLHLTTCGVVPASEFLAALR